MPNQSKSTPLADHELIEWAIREVRELDELCRSQVPAYGPLTSDDMTHLKRLQFLADRLR